MQWARGHVCTGPSPGRGELLAQPQRPSSAHMLNRLSCGSLPPGIMRRHTELLSQWRLRKWLLGGASTDASPKAFTKCWSLRRCTTRDVQSPMGTRSGDVLYKRSKHRAALCFTLSMVSLKDRHWWSLENTPHPLWPQQAKHGPKPHRV